MLYEDDELTEDSHDSIVDPLTGWPHEMRHKVVVMRKRRWWERLNYRTIKSFLLKLLS